MSPSEWSDALTYAAALWPASVEPGSAGVAAAWYPQVRGIGTSDACEAFSVLASGQDRFPTLAAFREQVRMLTRERQATVLKLPEPRRADWARGGWAARRAAIPSGRWQRVAAWVKAELPTLTTGARSGNAQAKSLLERTTVYLAERGDVQSQEAAAVAMLPVRS